DAELAVDVHHQPGAVEAGWAGAAPHIRHTEVLLRERRGLLSQRAGRRRRVGGAARSARSAAGSAGVGGRLGRLLTGELRRALAGGPVASLPALVDQPPQVALDAVQ